jgi:hypothetical protein
MAKESKRSSTVTAGSGYQSIKSTEIYTPDTAPINYQSGVTENNKQESASGIQITLEQDKPKNDISISDSFLENLNQVYISGQYTIRGHRTMRIREILSLIIHNNGLYQVVVTSPHLKDTIIAIIESGTESILGESLNKYRRNQIIAKFKHDNALV